MPEETNNSTIIPDPETPQAASPQTTSPLTKVEESNEIPELKTADDLLKEDVIKRLIAQERVPHEIEVNSGRSKFQNPRGLLISIPPPETIIGDSVAIEGASSPRISYWSPDGELRGYAKVLTATTKQAKDIRTIIQNIYAQNTQTT